MQSATSSKGGRDGSTAGLDLQPGPATDDIPRWADPLLWVGVLVPYLVTAIRWVGATWTPVQDHAVLDLRLQDLASGDLPLLGAFSRYGWSHPGPIWFYALAPFRLIGGSPVWSIIGSILLAGAGWATMVVFVRRRFGSIACVVAIGAMLVATAGAGAFTVVVPWNPHLAFAWFPLFLATCLSIAVGNDRDIPVAALVGSGLIQLHVGYAVLVGLPLAAVIALLLFSRDLRSSPRALWRRTTRMGKVLWGATVLVWIPPMVEQVANGSDGNVYRLVEFFVSPPDNLGEPPGRRFATAVLGSGLKIPPIGLGGRGVSIQPFTGWVLAGSPLWALLPLTLITTALGYALVRHQGPLVRAAAMAGIVWFTGWIALGRIIGDRWPYLFVWRFALAAFVIAVAGYVIVAAATGHTADKAGPRLGGTAMVIAVVIAGSSTSALLSTWEVGQLYPAEATVGQLLEQIDDSDPVDGSLELVRFGNILDGVGDGILLGLTERGWDVGVDESLAFKYTESRVQSNPTDLLLVTESSFDTSIAMAIAANEPLAFTTPLNAGDDVRITELQVDASHALVRAGQPDLVEAVGSSLFGMALDEAGVELDDDLVDELIELNKKVEKSDVCRCAVVVAPADSARAPLDWLSATAWDG